MIRSILTPNFVGHEDVGDIGVLMGLEAENGGVAAPDFTGLKFVPELIPVVDPAVGCNPETSAVRHRLFFKDRLFRGLKETVDETDVSFFIDPKPRTIGSSEVNNIPHPFENGSIHR